ncbi:MAG TPA: methylated-DNA--[protein]-cysteine S-methyltransferase [Opitutaceae bacterium]|jgi:methylated-DNA-[protein]-cysteine S-methyltransferase
MKREIYHYSEMRTPKGPFSVAVDDDGAVAAAAFGGRRALAGRIGEATLVRGDARTAAARRQIREWFGGRRRRFSVRLAPRGTPFQRRVWAELERIPFGETRSYGDLARVLGSSPRAVGRANATNPICVLLPCHRVVGADGSMTGYAFGEDLKRGLLGMEDR